MYERVRVRACLYELISNEYVYVWLCREKENRKTKKKTENESELDE